MNERKQKLEAVFHAAAELDSAKERERYLAEACAGDPELRREVDELLQSAEAADAVFQAGQEACRVGDTLPAAVLTEKPGDRIGRYKLLEKIGEGGMGVVYMADQEEPVRRRVALKIIKLGMDTKSVIARFEAERQALAMMDHPHIAKVLDAGATESGRPYFVMELVQGVPITEFCDKNQFSAEQRLKLFIPVCQAIQSAHQKGVIHRDIKPTNVLVTLHHGEPMPRVIDFGVAKATNQKLTEKTLFTNFATMIGTPAYMSPEQAEMSRLDVDTRSDIYSLGVLLYELLTGTAPFPEKRLRSVAYREMQRIIVEEEPERPSTRLTKALVAADVSRRKSAVGEQREVSADSRRRLQAAIALLRGDLDWIVLKCLEKDRARRYETANAVAMDIQRHLNCEPVIARPPSRLYEFQKTVRRHKFGFAAGAVVLTVLAAGVLVSTWQAIRATRAEREQILLRRDAQSKGRMLVRMLEHVGPSKAQGRDTQMLREILDETVKSLNEELKDQPEVEAELRLIIAKTYKDLALYPEAEAMVREALRLRTVRFGSEHPAVAEALNSLGAVLYEKGDLAGAKEVGLEAVALMEKLRVPDSVQVASALNNLGNVLQTLNDLDGAGPIHRRALAMRIKLLGEENEDVAKSYNSLGNVLLQRGNFALAEQSYSNALKILKRQPGGITNPTVATVTHNMAILVSSRGDLTRAEDMQRQVLAIRRTLLSNDHRDLAVTLNELAMVLAAQGTPEKIVQAEEMVTEAAGKKLLPSDHWRATTTINTLAMVLSRKGDLTAAEAKYREALDKRRELVGDTNLLTVESLNCLAVLLVVRGDLPGAETGLTNALRVRRKVQGDDNPELIKALMPLSWVKRQQGDVLQADSLRSESLSLSLRRGDYGVWTLLDSTYDLADPLEVLGKFAEAEVLLTGAFEFLESNRIANAAFRRGALEHLVRLYEAWHKPDLAATWRQKLADFEKTNNERGQNPARPNSDP